MLVTTTASVDADCLGGILGETGVHLNTSMLCFVAVAYMFDQRGYSMPKVYFQL